MWSVHTRNETTWRRYPPEVHADLPPRTSVARGARWRRPLHLVEDKQRKGGRRGARATAAAAAARVYSRYTAAASVSAMSARSDFYNAPCTLPHSRSLTPSHPPPRRGAEDPRERRASASVSRGDLRANVRERTNLRGTSEPRASRERVLRLKSDPFQRFSETFVNRVAATAEEMARSDESHRCVNK